MKTVLRIIWIMMGCVFLVACQPVKESAPKTTNETKAPQEADTIENEEIPNIPYSLTAEEIAAEQEGELFAKYLHEKELAKDEEYNPAMKEALNDYIKTLEAVKTDDWDAQEWANSIVANFRSHHGATINPLKDFTVVYEELTLPDGRLLQDVTEEELNQEAEPVHVAVLLDASGSMKADVAGGNKMKLAKASLESFSKGLPENVNVSLSVFGHKGTGADADKELSCATIETVYPLKPYNQNEFTVAMNSFQASGWTPLAAAIQQAEQDLLKVKSDNSQTFIYVISDGIETCDGNPVEAARKAKESVTNLQINIIGFDVDDEADRQLKEVAQAGGGEYSSAQNKQELDDLITKSWRESIGKVTWLYWNVHNKNDINWASIGMSNELSELQNNQITARNRESERMNATLNKLEETEKIDATLKAEIRELLHERADVIKTYADEIRKEKHAEIFDTAERLKNLVNEMAGDIEF